jgi:TonB family protein
MRALWVVALFVGLGTNFSSGQQNSPTPSPLPDAHQDRVKVYAVGPGVTAPELLPPAPLPNPAEKCKKKQEVDGKVVLSVLVDEAGQPRNLMFLNPLGNDLDKFALQIVAADRFKPGTHDGAPVVVAQSVEVDLQSCVVEKKDDAGKKTDWLRLRSQPVQKFGTLPQPPEEAVLSSDNSARVDSGISDAVIQRIGGSVKAPVVLKTVGAEFSDAAKKAKYGGICIVSLIVDVYGRPQNVRIVRPLDFGLSEKAIEAVNKFRFKPAMKNGEPVPVKISVVIEFHLY